MPPTAGNLVCVECEQIMRVQKNSVTVEELFADGTGYKLWDADLYACPSCGRQVISGFGQGPLAEHYEPTYKAARERLAPLYVARSDRG